MPRSQWYSQHRHHLRQLAALAFLGILVRLAVFRDVAVNGDTGLYLYDAKQLLWGHQLMVEYPSRSPVMEYLLAAVIWLGDSAIVSARAFMLLVSVAVGVAVYVLARQIHGHHAGLAASAFFLLTPFSVVWGLWVKTEQVAALLVIAAFIIALHQIDAESIPTHASLAIGALFGTAFLVRRVAIVHIGAFALFVCWYRWHTQRDVRGTLVAASSVVGAAAGVLVVAYLALAHGDPSLAADIAYHHAAALILSSGQGSLGWVGLESASAVTAASDPGLLAQICQKCGPNTITTFMRTMFVSMPVLVVLLPFLRSYTRTGGKTLSETALPASYSAVAVAVIPLLALSGRWGRASAALVIVAATLVVWWADPIDWEELWTPKLALPIVVLLALSAGYLYRDRIMYVSYFQDFYPYLVVVAGVTAVEFYRSLDTASRSTRRLLLAAGIVVMVASTGVAVAHAHPYQPEGVEDKSNWHTVDLTQSYGEDVERWTESGDRVFTAQPLYVIDSDRRVSADLSRKYYVYRGWPESQKRADTDAELVATLESGAAPLAVVDPETRTVLESDPVREAFTTNYCRVQNTPSRYADTAGVLYEYRPDAAPSECETYTNEPDN